MHFRAMEADESSLAAALQALHTPDSQSDSPPAAEYLSMFRQHCAHESYYGRLTYFLLARLLFRSAPRKHPEYPALFYRDLKGRACKKEKDSFLNTTIEFKNPASGIVFAKSFRI